MDQVKKDMEADDKLRKDWEQACQRHTLGMEGFTGFSSHEDPQNHGLQYSNGLIWMTWG